MTEHEKIKKLVEQYKVLFENSNMDVLESLKGEWLFCRYEKELHLYESLVRFETAEELAEILLGELSMDMFTAIDAEPEPLEEYVDLVDAMEKQSVYRKHAERLIKYLEESKDL